MVSLISSMMIGCVKGVMCEGMSDFGIYPVILQELRFCLDSLDEVSNELEDAETSSPDHVEELADLKKDIKKQKNKANALLKKISTFTECCEEEISSLWQCYLEIPEEEEV